MGGTVRSGGMDILVEHGLNLFFGLLSAGIMAMIALLNSRLKSRVREQDAIKAGMQAILRDRIIQAFNHYAEKGFCPIYARDNITHMYEAYHNLGGNGTITELYEKLLNLPSFERAVKK